MVLRYQVKQIQVDIDGSAYSRQHIILAYKRLHSHQSLRKRVLFQGTGCTHFGTRRMKRKHQEDTQHIRIHQW